MAGFIGELLFAIVRSVIADGAYALFVKVGAWLDTKIAGRTAKVIIGMLLGLAAFFLIPVFFGLLDL
ncbi:MAG: hypothetical protein PS018_17355 [bacterium]|nr:hypothetical protein [bacterium]